MNLFDSLQEKYKDSNYGVFKTELTEIVIILTNFQESMTIILILMSLMQF